jgi:hypothetical protein
MNISLDQMGSLELLRLYSAVLEELRQRGITRTANNPVSDYAELLVCKALNLERQTSSNKGFDAIDPRTHERYEIKSRRASVHRRPRRASPLRDLDDHLFDFLVVVLFSRDFLVEWAVRIPWSSVKTVSRYNAHLNGHIVFLNDSLWAAEDLLNLTEAVRAAQRGV